MAKNLDQTGVLQVNGAWATSVKYESEVLGARAGMVDLRFMQGRSEIARVSLLSEEVAEVIGEKNAASITRHLAGDADKYLAVVKGELRSARLHYREVRLEENAIEIGRDRLHDPSPAGTARSPDASATHSTSTAEAAQASDPRPHADPGRGTSGVERDAAHTSRSGPVPQHIVAKYLVKHDKYYFDDQTVAFVDRGSRLTVQTQNSAVIKDLIEIAKSREWQQIHVTGTKAFKREAWKEAYAAGLNISGYAPSAIELEAANRARSRSREANSPRPEESERATEEPVPVAQATTSPTGSAPRPSGRRAVDPARGVVYGTLIDHGVAPYRNDPSKSASYYVRLKDESGIERTHWGVGLADAIRHAQSSPKIGDEVGIRRVGSMPVTVVERAISDGQGAPSPIATKRHQWLIETAEFLKSNRTVGQGAESSVPTNPLSPTPAAATVDNPQPARPDALTPAQEVAAAIRSARTTREELQLKYPEINKALFERMASHDRFAEAFVKAGLIREADRAQVIALMRERLATDLERGTKIKEPDDKKVDTLIRRTVNRVAADIGRAPVEITDCTVPSKLPARDEMQVRA